MPAKRKIQKEDILKASISIISHEGLNALNARKLAKKLGCSTQPLFYIYENMDDLKKDVIDEIVKIFDREVLKSETGSLEYKDIGINYIRFAKEEPELFKLMFNNDMNEEAFDFINQPVNPDELTIRANALLKIKELRDTLGIATTTDELTGLHNRKYLQERLDAEMSRAKRYKTKLS